MPSAGQVGVVVMARTPRAGRTKTRLRPVLADHEAAALSEAMLADRCAQVAALSAVVPAIAFAREPPGSAGDLDPFPPPSGFRLVAQPEGDLGACLLAAAAAFLDEGLPVVLVDADSPTLPSVFLEQAVESLREDGERAIDLVLGPAEDGGYYLIGLRRPAPELFRDMPWSTAQVAAETLERARRIGLRVRVLPAWWDLDRPADLERLRGALLDASWPARTAEWLRAHERPPT